MSDGGVFESVKEPVTNYINLFLPAFQQIVADSGDSPLVQTAIHWGHGAAMATVLVAMGGIGTFLGWQIRNGNGSEQYWFTLGKTAREQHPLIMGLAFVFFLSGGQGGIVLLALQNKPILESPHAITAFIGMGLLAVQALLPLTFEKGGEGARKSHAFLGSATMVMLGVHGLTGLQLGSSF